MLLLIGCGCLFLCLYFGEWPDVALAGMLTVMWPAGLGRDGRGPGAATTAMWPAVWHGGRPTGRRAATRRIGLSVMP